MVVQPWFKYIIVSHDQRNHFIKYTVYVRKNATLIKHLCAAFSGPAALLRWLWLRLPHVLRCDLVKRVAFSQESPAILGLLHFTRRHIFRDNVKVRYTQRDKRGTRYTALISAATEHLLHSFWRIPYIILCIHFRTSCSSAMIVIEATTCTASSHL